MRVRVRMRPYRSTAVKTSLFTLTVPANTAGRVGSLVVTGGVDLGSGAYEPGTSLNALLRNMSSTPRNDEVVASLTLDPVNGGTRPLVRTARNRHSQTVTGERSIALEVS